MKRKGRGEESRGRERRGKSKREGTKEERQGRKKKEKRKANEKQQLLGFLRLSHPYIARHPLQVVVEPTFEA